MKLTILLWLGHVWLWFYDWIGHGSGDVWGLALIEGGAALVAAVGAIGVLWLTRRWGRTSGLRLGIPTCVRCGVGLRGQGASLPECCPECGRRLSSDGAVDWSGMAGGPRFFGRRLARWTLALTVGWALFPTTAWSLHRARFPMIGVNPSHGLPNSEAKWEEVIRARLVQEAARLDRATNPADAEWPPVWRDDLSGLGSMDQPTAERLLEATRRWTSTVGAVRQFHFRLMHSLAVEGRVPRTGFNESIAPWIAHAFEDLLARGITVPDELVIGSETSIAVGDLTKWDYSPDDYIKPAFTIEVEPPLPQPLEVRPSVRSWANQWVRPAGFDLSVPAGTPAGRRMLIVRAAMMRRGVEFAVVTINREVEFVTEESWQARHPLRPEVVESVEAVAIARIAPAPNGCLFECTLELPLPPQPSLFVGNWSLLVEGMDEPFPIDALALHSFQGGDIIEELLLLPSTILDGGIPDGERFTLRFTPNDPTELARDLKRPEYIPPRTLWRTTSVEFPIRTVLRCRSLMAQTSGAVDRPRRTTDEWYSQDYSFRAWWFF